MKRFSMLAILACGTALVPAQASQASGQSVTVEGPLSDARAHWLAGDVIVFDAQEGAVAWLIAGGERASLELQGVVDGELAEKFPHLAGQQYWRIAGAKRDNVRRWLKGPLAVRADDAEGNLLDVTRIQTGWVLDALYANDEPLGAMPTIDDLAFALWAPTARNVSLHLYEYAQGGEPVVVPMEEDPATGVWKARVSNDWDRRFYLFAVEVYVPSTGRVETNFVTDPYSLNLSADSKRSQVINLDDADLKPAGWDAFARDLAEAPEDRSIYELHVRDFSIADVTVEAGKRGKYMAFAESDTAGARHLTALANAGLSDVHLLPTNDCASIPETKQLTPGDLSAFAPDSEAQQAALAEVADQDGFNWCYDPLHYLAPEGSYASDANGVARILEFRQMVMGLDAMGLGTVLDVVFNHTPASGQADKSVLDKIVPGYYQRLNLDGSVANSTCCSNTASERHMMERLLVEGLMVWARDYKVSGFRFDLMGHHTKENILKGREALHTLTLDKHGVDGKDLLLYGEGWDFGEVGGGQRFVQATQANMPGTGIGTFNDRIRDAIRGGAYNSKAEEAVRTQGFASGLHTAPNRLTQDDPGTRDLALKLADHVRAGLAGSLADFAFEAADGEVKRTAELDYNGQPVGYVQDPQETVNYAAAHDNPTLFDSNVWKLPLDTSKDDRVRWQNLANSLVVLAQGMPFIHAGQDLLRTKSLDHNSYNSGDWFNFIDWSGQEHRWGRGLAHRADNEVDWPIARTLLADERMAMEPAHIGRAAAHMREMLAIRMSSPLFRMRTAAEVQEKLRFLNTGPEQTVGLIAMRLGGEGEDQAIVVFNATTQSQRVDIEDAADFALHPVLAASDDVIVRQAHTGPGRVDVPALTTAVFVKAD